MADEYETSTPRDDGIARDTVEHTTVINTDRGGGGGGILAVVILLIAVLALLYLFRDQLGLGGSHTTIKVPDKINVNVN
jgi:uncharacterized membrane protein